MPKDTLPEIQNRAPVGGGHTYTEDGSTSFRNEVALAIMQKLPAKACYEMQRGNNFNEMILWSSGRECVVTIPTDEGPINIQGQDEGQEFRAPTISVAALVVAQYLTPPAAKEAA